MTTVTNRQIDEWVAGYVHAWKTGLPDDIAALFAEDAEAHEWPYETHWLGRSEIVEGWLAREHWQKGGWSFEWSLLTINGDTFAIEGVGSYTELGRFKNLWVVTLGSDGRCTVMRHWNNEL